MRSVFLYLLSLSGFFQDPRTDLTDRVDTYVARESGIAKDALLANIGPHGSKASGAKAGIVIASPSTYDPDYLFTWTRDAALVLKTVVDTYDRGKDDSLRKTIDNYVKAQAALQQVTNPSGSVSTGGLAEPKFHIDGTAFTENWGRPQRDGPALRSTALIAFSNVLLRSGDTDYVNSTLWPVIQLDLDYVANYWNQTGFDLWEEVSSKSFYTTAVQHRALRDGAILAKKLEQDSLASLYTTQGDNVLCFLQSYWNPDKGYITSNTGGGRSGIDANSALASIQTFDPEAGCDAATFQPCSDKALSSLKVYADSFRSIYPINKDVPHNGGVATGRYPEDVWYNGNPWYLTTAAAAEQLYDSLIVWKGQGFLNITDISLAFFRQFSPSISTGSYDTSTDEFEDLIYAIEGFADEFIAMNAKYTPKDGSLAEQYHRDDGRPLSAADLTWSYASALTAFAARNGTFPRSWGAKDLVVPSVCHADPGPTVQATFNVVAHTQYGENIFLTGNTDSLKNWSPDHAIALSPANYPIWTATVTIPANAIVEYKYIRKFNGGVSWEAGPNRQTKTPASGSYTLDDNWRAQ